MGTMSGKRQLSEAAEHRAVAPGEAGDRSAHHVSRVTGPRLARLFWVGPTLLTLVVALAGIDRAQLWRDELATWSAATRPVGDLIRLAGTIDAATGPYYLVMHGWVAVFGDSTTALRLPSALAMAGAAGLTARLGERLAGARVGLLAGLLFAVLPGTSRYAQEARPYALATLLAVLATLLLVEALRRPGWLRWAGYAVAVAALGLTHLIALTLLAAHAAAVLLVQWRGTAAAGLGSPPAGGPADARPSGDRPPAGVRPTVRRPGTSGPDSPSTGAPETDPHPPDGRPAGVREPDAVTADDRQAGAGPAGDQRAGTGPLWRWLVAVLPAAALAAPLVLAARGQRSRQLDWVDLARLSDLAALPGGVAQSSAVGGLLLGLAALGAGRLGRRALLPAAGVLLPVALVFAAGLVVPLWVPRYLVFTVPFGCLLAGAALASVRLAPALAVVALAGLLGLPDQVGLRRTHEWPRSAPIDYAGAAQVIADHQQPGDAIVFSPRDSWLFLDLGTAYHLGSRQPRDVLLVRDQRQRADLWAGECDRPAECLAGARRVWLVVTGRRNNPVAAVPGAKGAALRDGFTVRQVWPRPGLTVALLTR